ncbi:Na+/H+ antiporter NhaA [Diaminobutyricibacter tongyongensis]|uniref:Na+/H+ antiporter NhaA n=1 Tax=Leifsonia tongyongensis TaxID=1268043 RepID=UPI0019628D9B
MESRRHRFSKWRDRVIGGRRPPPGVDGGTVWIRSIGFGVARFVRTEAASSVLLIIAITAALIWSNLGGDSYQEFWNTRVSARLGPAEVSMTLTEFVSSGLMTFFFLVIGLEARRELDLGALRDHRRLLVPIAAGLAGMALPVLIFLSFNAGTANEHGWAVAMSTDTALALGLITFVGKALPAQIRAFILTVFIVDDLVALAVITFAYTGHVEIVPLMIAVFAFAVMLLSHRLARVSWLAVPAAIGAWIALFFSGVDPIVLGLIAGLTAPARVPTRRTLDDAAGSFRRFREQPTPQSARLATLGLKGALSVNERLQTAFLPWTSYVIVPLFALANAGISLEPSFLLGALMSPVALGVIVAYLVGKPVAVLGVPALISWLSRGKLRPPVGWVAVAGSGTIAGVGFTVAVLVAGIAFTGRALAEAKLGVLVAAIVATALTWAVFRLAALLGPDRRSRALLGDAPERPDLVVPVDPNRDHIRGNGNAAVTVVEYGDFQCPYCGRAEREVRQLLSDEDVRFVWRNLPIADVHPRAQAAAEAAEAAGSQGAFWAMHDLLLHNQNHLDDDDLLNYASILELDLDRFGKELAGRTFQNRVEEDLLGADLSGAAGTPTFFINGRRHYGAYDVESLRSAVMLARDASEAATRRATTTDTPR